MKQPSHPDRAAIEAGQLDRLKPLIAELGKSNNYYAPRLAAAGLTDTIDGLGSFFARMPFTTKQELVADQQLNPPFGNNLTYPLDHYTRYSQTSATTGQPLRWLDTPQSWEAMLDNWQWVYETAGVHAGDHVLFAFSFGPFLGFWTAFEAAMRLGCLCLPGGGMSSTARLHAIMESGVTVLCCTPTYALRLAEVAGEEKIDLAKSHVRLIIVAGEPGGSVSTTRARLQQLWPTARIRDHHGMTEVGPVTYECPARECVLHVMEDSYLAEIVDPHTGEPQPPGRPGELVLTTLRRIGSPVLRYRTGDLVKPIPGPCACGRHELALDGGILGRTDDMVLVRGVNVYPSAVDEVVRGQADVAEYRVEIRTDRSMSEVRILVEPGAHCTDTAALAARLEHGLRDLFALRIPVTIVLPGTLPRFDMKARRWVYV